MSTRKASVRDIRLFRASRTRLLCRMNEMFETEVISSEKYDQIWTSIYSARQFSELFILENLLDDIALSTPRGDLS